MFWTDDEVLVG